MNRKRKFWLTQCHSKAYMITLLRPKIAKIRGTQHLDAFERIGEPFIVKHMCAAGIRSMFGREFAPLTPTRVNLIVSVDERN